MDQKTRIRKSELLKTRTFLLVDTDSLLKIQQSCCMCSVTFKVLLYIFFFKMASTLKKTPFHSVNEIAFFLPSNSEIKPVFIWVAKAKVCSAFLHFLSGKFLQTGNRCAGILAPNSSTSIQLHHLLHHLDTQPFSFHGCRDLRKVQRMSSIQIESKTITRSLWHLESIDLNANVLLITSRDWSWTVWPKQKWVPCKCACPAFTSRYMENSSLSFLSWSI